MIALRSSALPFTAIMVPRSPVAEFKMLDPRSSRISYNLSSEKTPEAHNAAYSPELCPAVISGVMPS